MHRHTHTILILNTYSHHMLFTTPIFHFSAKNNAFSPHHSTVSAESPESLAPEDCTGEGWIRPRGRLGPPATGLATLGPAALGSASLQVEEHPTHEDGRKAAHACGALKSTQGSPSLHGCFVE